MARTSSGETAATSVASEEKQDSTTALCTLDIATIKIEPQDDLSIIIGNISHESSLTKIEGTTINQFTQWIESPTRLGRLFFYSSEDGVLIIKYPISPVHEALHGELYDRFRGQTYGTPLWKEIARYGSTTYHLERLGYLTTAGEGDSSLGLKDRGSNNGWPTVVIEAGWTQSKPSLVAKAHWWFEASNGAVKIVLLVIGSPLRIQIEKWKAGPIPPSSAAPSSTSISRPNTRLNAALLREAQRPRVHPPVLMIERSSTDTPRNNYRVIGSPLRLEFRDVLLRDPVPPEGDFLLEADEIRDYAEAVWAALPDSDS
ncbi:unnamed protein product [Clonostachys rosea f. rosea IK726]|uniref:Uncharacterized protein n=2 Tax=Bionectria ochroleuca TaxID=29856 RepID=A0A0B7K2I0_BIOOC|nr:unnamed protein product [Clonostachys rosea f. rosea IK726]